MLDEIPSQAKLNTEQRHSLDSFLRGRMDRDAFLHALDVTYVAPVGDAFLLQLPAVSFDLVFSMDVLEHVRPDDMDVILRGQRHILRPGGLAYHDIGLGDHLTSVDSSITFSNFLQYDGWLWRYLGENQLAYHNRLRSQTSCASFRAMAPMWSGAKPALMEEARADIDEGKLKVSDRFAGHALDDLATSRLRVLMSCQPRGCLASNERRSPGSRAAAS